MTVNSLRKRAWHFGFRVRFGVRKLVTLARKVIPSFDVALRAALFVGTALGLGAFINAAADLSRLTAETLINVLIAMGTMFGGVLAIVFALSSFMQQNAADLYSSQFYEVYARDWREKLIFSAIAVLTVLSFALAIFQDTAIVPLRPSFLVYVILLVTAAVFALVDWQYKLVTKKINPLIALAFLERQCMKSLESAHDLAKHLASWLRISNEQLTEEQALAVSYSRFVAPYLTHVDRQLDHLTEISLRLAAKGELLATQRGLASAHNVLAKYLQFRKDSSLAIPAGPYLMAVESDSQWFLARTFQRINTAGEMLMAQRQSASVVFLMDLYASLATYAKEVQFLNRPGENPIIDQLRGYMSGLLDAAIRVDDVEVCFRSVAVSRAIGTAAVERKLHSATRCAVYGDLTKVAMWAIASKKPVFIEHCTDAMVQLIGKSINDDGSGLDTELAEAFDRLTTITSTMYTAVSAGLVPSAIDTQIMVGKCYGQLAAVLAAVVDRYERLIEGHEKRALGWNLAACFKALYRSLREMSEVLKNCDAPVVFNIASLIEEILKMLVRLSTDTKGLRERHEFEKQLSWYVHLPGWFVEHASNVTLTDAFDTLADIGPKVGLQLLHRNAPSDSIVKCAQAAFSITKQMLAKLKGGYAYAEPRHMLTVCYLGIVALKQGAIGSGVVQAILSMVREFEELYRKKYFSTFTPPAGNYMDPRPQQLMVEVLRWRSDVIRERYNIPPLLDRSRDIVRQMVDVADIDRFIFEVWRMVPSDSPIKAELTDRQRRHVLMLRLLRLLSAELQRRQPVNAPAQTDDA
ncbi:MAG TPA: hypothetical protein VF198_14715 [Vicinamibacterales bacterium]